MKVVNAQHLTVRHLPTELSQALEEEKRRRGTSLNQTVIDLLQLGLGVGGTRSNGLKRLAGTWPESEHREFLESMEGFNEIDPEMWK